MIRRYVGESRAWCSVTPVILPGYDDFKALARHDEKQPTKAERLLLKCLIHAGIPIESVESVTLRRAPFWPGSQHPQRIIARITSQIIAPGRLACSTRLA